MKTRNGDLFIEKFRLFKRAGYSIVALALVFLMLRLYILPIRSGLVTVVSSGLLGIGLLLIAVNKGIQIIQYSKLRTATVRCSDCGWIGVGEQWFRHECCPECDSEKVSTIPEMMVN